MFQLRPAAAQDAAAIRKLVHSAHLNPSGLDWPRFSVAVAQDEQVIGCAQIKPHGDGTRELASLVVQPGWQGQGVARALIERLLAANSGDLYLMCRAGLGPFYQRFGFAALSQAELPPYFRRIYTLFGWLRRLAPRGEGLLVMRRPAPNNDVQRA